MGATPTSGRRLDLLQRIGLLHAARDPAFDRLARLALRLTGARVGIVAFLGEEHEYRIGHAVRAGSPSELRAGPLSRGLARFAVTAGAPVIVPDTRLDARLHAHPATLELGIRAYAGLPLFCEDEPIGALCIAETHPRAWTRDDVDALRDLAAAATTEIELRLALARHTTAGHSLVKSERRYRSVLAAMGDGVALMQADGEVTACNGAATHILGLDADQMAGHAPVPEGWRAVSDDGTPVRFVGDAHPARVTLRTGEPLRGQVIGVHKPSGETTWVAVSTEPIRGEHPDAGSVVATFRDVTQERDDRVELAEYAREQAALREFATLVASGASPRAVFDAAARHVVRVFDARSGGVVRVQPDGTAVVAGSWARQRASAGRVDAPVDLSANTAVARAIATCKPASVDRGAAASGTELAVPITVRGKLWGVVSVVGDADLASVVSADDRLARFADLVELAVVGAGVREQLSHLALVDHLTGIDNHRAFTERLHEEVRRARRYRRPLSLVMFDLDHFKRVNDTYGHDVGNRTLAAFADRLARLRRGGEAVARVGGEEFAWILPDTDGERACLAADRARRVISGTPFSEVGRLTVSAGVCSLTDAGSSDELFQRADLALYCAKSASRDATVRYTPEASEALSADARQRRLQASRSRAEVAHRPADPAVREPRPPGGRAVQKAGRVDEASSADPVAWVGRRHQRFGGGRSSAAHRLGIIEGARLLGVAEAWDTMTIARSCGLALPDDELLAELRRHTGTRRHFEDAVLALLVLRARGQLADFPR